MAEPAGERGPEIAHDVSRPDRQKLAPKAAGHKPQRHVDEPIGEQQPHGGEMPEQAAGQPAAKRDTLWKCEREQWRGVVDLPTRADHDQHGQRIDPMGDPHVERMNVRSRRSRVGAAHVGCALHVSRFRHGCVGV